MKKIPAIVIFFCFQALLIFLQVHKQGKYLKVSYQIQQLQTLLASAQKQKNDLIYNLYQLQKPDNIKAFAEKDLKMIAVQLKDVKSVNSIK